MIFLSFVIPCYNVGLFIQMCLDSIFACDLETSEYEVLAIDDCSSDCSLQILRENSVLHPNLRIISNSTNKGLGAGRNTGIREARGKYIWFVDADDFISGQCLNKIVKGIEDSELDVLGFNYRKTDIDGNELSVHDLFSVVSPTDGYSFVNKVFGRSIVYHMGYVVRFLYKTDYLRVNQLFFPEGVFWEDTVYMPKALLKARRVASVPDVLYSYRTNPLSISNVYLKQYPAKHIYDWSFKTGKELLDFSDEVKDPDLKKAFRSTAIHKYVNGFSLLLFRTNYKERKAFYTIVKGAKKDVSALREEFTLLSRLLLSPFGLPMASLGSAVYKFTHRRNNA